MKNQVVILGGGIAGVEAAIYYRKEGFEVELISDRPYVFIYPIAIWIPVKTTRFEDVAFPLEKLAARHGFTLTIDRVRAIDAADRRFTLEQGGNAMRSVSLSRWGRRK
jgi:sulfide:quinone oxidoreductase